MPFSGCCRTLSPHESNRSILVGPFCRVYVKSPSPSRNCLLIGPATSCRHVLARLKSHHTREVARCWIRVSTLLCREDRGLSNITIAVYGTTQSRNCRGSGNGWMATKIIIFTTHTLSTAWVIQTQWAWCPKARRQVSCPLQDPIPL